MKTIDEIERAHPALTAIRRDFHAHPEVAFEEVRTSARVAELLTEWGIEVTRGLGKTGLVGVLRGTGGTSTRSLKPLTGSEDFSFFLEKVPGSYLFLGNGTGEHRGYEAYEGMGPCELHNPNYDFNDALLPIGGSYWVKLTQAFFAKA
jgi:metal-dependent amidase/aminoacylase/carboxypeptidase family protein